MLEINVSCPNVSAGGMSAGTDPVALANLMDRLRPMPDKPIIRQTHAERHRHHRGRRARPWNMAPNACSSMINTLKGMRINIRTGKPIIAANVTGGVSGPAVLPVGLAAVYRVRTALPDIPDHRPRRHRQRREGARIPVRRRERRRSGCGRALLPGGPAARRPRTRRPVGQPSRTRC